MKESVFNINEEVYIRITNVDYFITLNFIGKIQRMNIVLERDEAQRLIEEMSRILEGEK